ncbi:RodZ domain-containing protein [Colwellia echini]|uniref:DUF4115 domain-containing protein n=1 Tax=Colwellia echini TaxID=1982103 RepID=A0ABY3N1M3_9GAMM|nr:RodZ domain-containing protein [Colwellia echini]TYK67381.1 DUF4115 domain-containing protein [Colwellia echini]
MNNEVNSSKKESTKKSEKTSNQQNDEALITELSEDMEMVSPGAMLLDARKAQSLSQEHIAAKLNFTLSLVKDLESNNFDPSIPVTFIRGYLANYAKVVNVDVEDVLASYDALDAATIQRSEMLSFSKQTSKQAEHSRVMWLSYLIVAVLIGLTILWWQQENSQQTEDDLTEQDSTVVVNVEEDTQQSDVVDVQSTDLSEDDEILTEEHSELIIDNDENTDENIDTVLEQVDSAAVLDNSANTAELATKTDDSIEAQTAVLSTAVFTFSGDCWVNIFDATGERIAWGVKKTGYVMTVQGVAPLRITVGKPELTSIVFNDHAVDMSSFNIGNIAKFTLPLDE